MHQELELQDDKVKKLEQLLKQKDDEIQTRECIILRIKEELQQKEDKLREEEKRQVDNDYYIETFEMEKRKLSKRIRNLEDQLGIPDSISPQPTVVHSDPEQANKVVATIEQQAGGELEQHALLVLRETADDIKQKEGGKRTATLVEVRFQYVHTMAHNFCNTIVSA